MPSNRETSNKMVASKRHSCNDSDDRFLIGPGEKCTWGHRMQNTRDHSEISDLRKAVGLGEKETTGVSKTETNGTKPAVVSEQNDVVASPAAPSAPAEPAASDPDPVTA